MLDNKQEPKKEDLDLDNFSSADEPSMLGVYAKKFGLLVFEVIKVVLISLAIIIPIRYFLAQPFYVEGASMEPNFYDKEYLIIDEISYRFNEPQRGEVIVFKNPENTSVYFIKRIIGLPGEEVDIKDGHVYIDGATLVESYITEFSSEDYGPIILNDNEYFVLGDNRNNSHDSRRIGAIPENDIIGRTWFRGWPLNRIGTFNIPSY